MTGLRTLTNHLLRSDLVLIELESDQLRIEDPLSKRQFVFDEMQAAVLKMFDGTTSSEQIADELFGDLGQQEAVEKLADHLSTLALLDSGAALNVYEIRLKQAAALRSHARKMRNERVASSVRWAQANLPFYKEKLASIADEVHSVADLSKLPCTTKSDIREHFPIGLMPEAVNLEEAIKEGDVALATTSGSTGGRLQFIYHSHQSVSATLELFKGGFNDRRRVTFTTPICSGQVCHLGGTPYEERLFNETRLMLNSTERVMRLDKPHLEEIIEDIERFQPVDFCMDPVYGVALIRAFERFDLPLPKMEALMAGFEFLTQRHRKIIEAAFDLPLANSLGATDLGGPITLSCENNRMHVLNHVVLEYLRDDKPVMFGEVGELTVTFADDNPYTRLIRYRVGDLGRPIESCGCVWDDWPCLELEGKIKDTLIATDGTRVTSRGVDDLFIGLDWLDFYQLTQRSADEFEMLGVRWAGTESQPDEGEFRERFGSLLGLDAKLRIRYVRELPIEQSFKFPQTKQKSRAPLEVW